MRDLRLTRSFYGEVEDSLAPIQPVKGRRALDNVSIEWLWRSLKYEEVYLKDYRDLSAARSGIGPWFRFYNRQRTLQVIESQTSWAWYRGLKSLQHVAA